MKFLPFAAQSFLFLSSSIIIEFGEARLGQTLAPELAKELEEIPKENIDATYNNNYTNSDDEFEMDDDETTEEPYFILEGNATLNTLRDDTTGTVIQEALLEHTNVEVVTKNGAWLKDIYLPPVSEQLLGSTFTLSVESKWSVNLHFSDKEGNVVPMAVAEGQQITLSMFSEVAADTAPANDNKDDTPSSTQLRGRRNLKDMFSDPLKIFWGVTTSDIINEGNDIMGTMEDNAEGQLDHNMGEGSIVDTDVPDDFKEGFEVSADDWPTKKDDGDSQRNLQDMFSDPLNMFWGVTTSDVINEGNDIMGNMEDNAEGQLEHNMGEGSIVDTDIPDDFKEGFEVSADDWPTKKADGDKDSR